MSKRPPCGTEFQMWGPKQEKARKRLYCWIFSIFSSSEEERSVRDGVYRYVAVQKGKLTGPEPFIALKHIQATLYLIRSEMGSQCSFSRRGVEWWWRGAKRTSLAAKFEFSGEVG